MTGGYVKTYVIDVNTSHTPEEGALSLSWPNGIIIIIITPTTRHRSLQRCYCLYPCLRKDRQNHQ